MLIIILMSLICLTIGFILGRIRPKILARAIHRFFRGTKFRQSLYETSDDTAVTYLIELEKQEIEAKHKALSHMTIANTAGIALSGALSSSTPKAFHWLAIGIYMAGIVFSLIGHLSIGESRRFKYKEILKNIQRKNGKSVLIPASSKVGEIFTKTLTFFTYLAFVAGILLTIISFSATADCINRSSNMNPFEKLTCELVDVSNYFNRSKPQPRQNLSSNQLQKNPPGSAP